MHIYIYIWAPASCAARAESVSMCTFVPAKQVN